jgi:hypothetical protein
MKKAIGILLHDSNDAASGVDIKILIKRGDSNQIEQGLLIGNTMNQNQALMLIASPGDFKANPTLGVSINDLMLDQDYLGCRHRIREHFLKDGLNVRRIQLESNKPIVIDASYE